jgi:LuxR family maltose regulon positive regulatory protein
VDEGEPMELLIADFRLRIGTQARSATDSASGRLPVYVNKLLAAFPGAVGPAQSATSNQLSEMVEPLSERELQVLRLIADGLSNAEIAEKLVIAQGTVKRHINNIYGKLGVQSRTQAVARSRELGLL